jgi:hypothetical protein
VGRTGDVDFWKVEARLALALGCSPERILIAFDSGWYRETARSTCFLSWGSRLQLSINERARELPYTFIFSLARREVSCGGSPRSASEILNRLNEVSFNAVLLKELRMIALLRQVADPGKSEGAQWAGMRIHRIANEMLTELGASSKPNAEWADKIARLQHAIFGLSFEKGEGDQLGHRLEIWLNGCDPTALGASA